MIRLPNTGTYSLELVTAQNGAQVVVCYSDATSNTYVGGIQTTTISSATTTTICSTPVTASTVRDVDEINIKNTFAGSHTITVQVDANATNIPLVTAALLTDESLNYTHGSGWQCKDANGNTKTTPLTAMTSAQLAAIVSDETGSGALVFATSPAFVTSVTGSASMDVFNTVSTTVNAFGAATALSLGAATGTLTLNNATVNVKALSATGNVTLGDATTDTVRINGYAGIGGAPDSSIGCYVQPTGLTGTTQYGTFTYLVGNTSASVAVVGHGVSAYVDGAAVFPLAIGMRINQVICSNGATVTSAIGLRVNNQSVAAGVTNAYGIEVQTISGENKWGYYGSGTANNAFAGNTRFGGVTAPVATVDVTGNIAATTSILSSGATSGIGYTTDAGGTVTQITSRTTGVTINKITGSITLVSAAGSATWQSFTVTNSAVAATDKIILNQKSGTDLYLIHITNVAAGSFQVSFATTGGTTTEQPVFGFSITKGVEA